MSDRMTPIPFPKLMHWIWEEHEKDTIFGTHKRYHADRSRTQALPFGRIETPIGPAAGPHTQLAQNIVVAYAAGARFFELKTVQKIDGEDLPVEKPCIKADDEGYNVEWSTELTVEQAFEEYVKAFFAIKVLAIQFGLGSPDGFLFNMSVGYDLAGIRLPKIDRFIENMKDAKDTGIYISCRDWLRAHPGSFPDVGEADARHFGSRISDSVTLSTLHGCPPDEIERIARYLITEKHLHTFVKCNPTLLGYETARSILDEMGYDYVSFTDHHFKEDLQYADAVPMFARLCEAADDAGLSFGVKLTNTFPVDIRADELPGTEMYMSGKPLIPLGLTLAAMLAGEFGGRLKLSFAGGADAFYIREIVACGIWPVTMATTLLKPGGYDRFEQMAALLADLPLPLPDRVDADAVKALLTSAKADPRLKKELKAAPNRTLRAHLPLVDCFLAPCEQRCPINQDITTYMRLVGRQEYAKALRVILDKNPLPFMTGTLCPHTCTLSCTRNYYDTPVSIRDAKLLAAERGYEAVMREKSEAAGRESEKSAAVVGGGPAGLAAAYFLARGGVHVTVFEQNREAGGTPRQVIPDFRIESGAIDRDIALVKRAGVTIVTGVRVERIGELAGVFDYCVLACGASGPIKSSIPGSIDAISFLSEYKMRGEEVSPGRDVIVIGGGNTAMDVARAAKRCRGTKSVRIVYRRTRRFMPADEEEFLLALGDGVEFEELKRPVAYKGGYLLTEEMRLGDYDASGRRSVIGTGSYKSLRADAVITATGQELPTDFYRENGIALAGDGRPLLDPETMETSREGIFLAGDGARGPATIVEGIRDGKRAAESILGTTFRRKFASGVGRQEIYGRKGYLLEGVDGYADTFRCLGCNLYCEHCVEVCPNRANLSVEVRHGEGRGMQSHQIIHLDALCNECGNCASFCPYDSAPYRDKLTYYDSLAAMEEGTNHGFALTDREKGLCRVRIAGRMYDYTCGGAPGDIGYRLAAIIDAFVREYSYVL